MVLGTEWGTDLSHFYVILGCIVGISIYLYQSIELHWRFVELLLSQFRSAPPRSSQQQSQLVAGIGSHIG